VKCGERDDVQWLSKILHSLAVDTVEPGKSDQGLPKSLVDKADQHTDLVIYSQHHVVTNTKSNRSPHTHRAKSIHYSNLAFSDTIRTSARGREVCALREQLWHGQLADTLHEPRSI
jgi:hypothetical protein